MPFCSATCAIAVLWPASVVATAAVTAGVLTGFLLPDRTGPTEAGPLALTTAGVSQTLFGAGTDQVVGASFHGLTVVRSTNVFGSPGLDCLAVFQTASDPEDIQGPMYSGCAAGALPAIVQVGVDRVSPAALRQLYADGTGLRFVLDGDRVRVLVDRTAAETPGT